MGFGYDLASANRSADRSANRSADRSPSSSAGRSVGRWAVLGPAVVAGLLAVACGSGDDASEPTSTTAPTTAEAPATTRATTTTTEPEPALVEITPTTSSTQPPAPSTTADPGAPTTAPPTTGPPTTEPPPPPRVFELDWSKLTLPTFFAYDDQTNPEDPFWYVHNQPTEGFFLSLEMYTTGFGSAWTGETGTFELSCTDGGTGICIHFDPDGDGEAFADLNLDFAATGTIEITALDEKDGYDLALDGVTFSDGTTIAGPTRLSGP